MSGISILRNLLLKEAVKGSGQASGIMSIGDNVRKLADKRLTSYLIDAQKQGVDIDAMNEQQIKYILEMNKKPNYRVISQGDPEFVTFRDQILGKKNKDNVIEAKFGKPFAEEVKKFRGPVKEKKDIGDFGKINVEVDYSASLDRPEFFDPKAKNMFGETVATGSEFIKKERERILNTINRKKKEMVPTTHPNYRLLKKSLQDQEDALEAIKITEDLGGNENMFDFLRTKNISDYKSKPLKRSDYVKTDDPEDFADGGVAGLLGERQNFAMGKRAFLKLLGSVGAGIAGLKTGVGLGGKKIATEVAKDVATESTTRPPEYFFRLVEKIKFMGDDAVASKDKAIAKTYKDYTMEEDFSGNIEIIKKSSDEYYPEDVYMSYKVDEVPLKGKKGSTKVEEYEEYTARPDEDGKMKDVEPGVPNEVIDEAGDTTAMTLKKADGGIARMLGE
jgi:hypothetical protein